MRIKSHFLESELIFWREGSEVIDHGDHLGVKTRSNPNWRWGNLLIFSRSPEKGDHERWMSLFERHFPEGRPHRMFVWDDPEGREGYLQEFLDHGFRLQHDHILATSTLVSPRAPSVEISVREPESDQEWEAIINTNAQAFGEGIPNYHAFVRGLLQIHRSLIAKGQGFWHSAYVDGVLAGSCGVFTNGSVTRFQEVSVAPEFRCKGVASNLVYHAAAEAKARDYPMPLLMVADIDTQAERIYKRLGFEQIETSSSLRIIPEDKKG